MTDAHKITSLDATWRPGDIRVRSDHPKWVWGYPNEGSTRSRFGGPAVPDGGLEEHDVPRPLTLLVRDGQAVGGHLVDEPTPPGT
ncbi:hypothetical protein ABT390_36655 [Streptomyces aurantiacus]|uniref:Uncharacterized protein n=1 Tax=Streptomyces aurantiacus JA 4570 TaxID=1286094 RepID=S3ZAX4_9ACTN|nr:hypothetical protein [Streptomyces aurantiacus]EPH40866.1 hypothetical protein STRAU_6081 [Streptomyces aurantiacus JA 4570]